MAKKNRHMATFSSTRFPTLTNTITISHAFPIQTAIVYFLNDVEYLFKYEYACLRLNLANLTVNSGESNL